MWKEYSRSYLKNNRASGVSVTAAAFIATLFFSLLCSLAYNFWTYDIEKITLEEGNWQGRITGELGERDLTVIQNFANVEKAVINEGLTGEKGTVVDVYFQNPRTIYKDMPPILNKLELSKGAATYHSLLLSRYFIHDPDDSSPPLLLAFYAAILFVLSVSLILIIRNSFELSMRARIHQFGIFSSIGATPGQIRICLLQEAAMLCAVPILIGSAAGIFMSAGLIRIINLFAADVPGRHAAVFQYHPAVLVLTILVSVFTVLVSVWIPAEKLSKMTPLEAIRNADGELLKKRKHAGVLSALFGIEGELAGNALKAQRKSLRISTISLFLSFLGFSVMLCFTTLSGISTRYTYFERYKDAWDIMISVKHTAIENFDMTKDLRKIEGVADVTVYQKAEEMTFIPGNEQSSELTALGGLKALGATPETGNGFWVKAPVVILDDESFLAYCSRIGITPDLDGTVVLNRIWDSKHSNYRDKKYIPFVSEDRETNTLRTDRRGEESADVPVLAYTEKTPVLREEYKEDQLVHFMSVSAWKTYAPRLGGAETDSYIRMFADDAAALASLDRLEERTIGLLGDRYEIESENRIREKVSNDALVSGSVVILGGFCVLLAMIGIANVFANTLGFLRQRRREFARYRSIGITPSEMRKMFGIEAFVIAGRPLLLTLIITVVSVQFMISASHLDPKVFWAEAPIIPILVFAAVIIGFVALAYYIGGRRLLGCDLSETIRDDTLA